MTEAITHKPTGTVDFTAAAALTSGQIKQLASGLAAVVAGLAGIASGDPAAAYTEGQFRVNKSTSVVFLDGQEVWWDEANGRATYCLAGTFPIGVAVGDTTAAATTVVVDLNVKPRFAVEQNAGEWDHEATNGLGVTVLGGAAKLAFDAVLEAAQAALHSIDSVPVNSDWIFEAEVAIYDIGDAAALDINIGVASGSHATDADAIAESVFAHLDGSALSILAESDDGTTEVAATDTTKDAVDDTYFFLQIDGRDPASVKIYINGARVLDASTFVLTAAAGPLIALAHVEKTSDDTTADVRVKNMRIRKAAA